MLLISILHTSFWYWGATVKKQYKEYQNIIVVFGFLLAELDGLCIFFFNLATNCMYLYVLMHTGRKKKLQRQSCRQEKAQ